MRFYRIIITLLLVFILTSQAFTQKIFETVDYSEMLHNNPIAKKYDPETKRFKDTISYPTPIEDIQNELQSMLTNINELENKKAELTSDFLAITITENNKNWETIAEIDRKIENLKSQIPELDIMMSKGGLPEHKTVYKVIADIRKSIEEQYLEMPDVSSETIFLNILPRSKSSPPPASISEKGLLSFLSENDSESLKEYLEHSYSIGMLFDSVTLPILYQRGKHD